MRQWLDRLYRASAALAGLSMVAVLAMVLLTVLSRLLGSAAPGADAYAGYATAGAGFLALASTLKHGEHIRVTLLIGTLQGRLRRWAESGVLVLATALAAFFAFYSVHLVWQSWEINDISVGIDATPMWIPQLLMAVGAVVFLVAICDELVLELLGRRQAPVNADAHHE